MNKKYRKRLLLVALLALVGIGVYYFFSPEDSELFPKCPFLMLTGWECPGCGSQRAVHHLLHLRIAEAMQVNLLMVVSIPYVLLGIYMEYFGGNEAYPRLRSKLFGYAAARVAFVLIVLYWIARNLIKYI